MVNVDKIPFKGGDECDALGGARKFYHWRAGTVKAIKRGYDKRVRRAWKRDADQF